MKTTILLKPIVTEKSMDAMHANMYTFQVSPRATKHQIKTSVENQFKVTVLDVSTFVRKGKTKSIGKTRKSITRQNKKYARVRLTQGQTIDVFAVTAESTGKK